MVVASGRVFMAPGRREPRNISELDPSSFGAQLRRLRMDAGLSQEELGEAIGTDQTRISAYERNRFRPNEDIILDIARVLHVQPGVLMESSQWGGALPTGCVGRHAGTQARAAPEWVRRTQR